MCIPSQSLSIHSFVDIACIGKLLEMFARYLVSALLASTVAARNPGQAIPLSHIIEFEYGAVRSRSTT